MDHALHIGDATVHDGDFASLPLIGELDAINTDLLRTRWAALLRTAEVGIVGFDLAGLTYLDSSGIRCLLDCRLVAREAGREFRLVNPSEMVVRVLSITGLLELLGLSEKALGQSD